MKTVDDLIAAAGAAGFPTMSREVLVDTGRLAMRIRVRVRGETAHLRLRLLWGRDVATRDDRYVCPVDQFVHTLQALRTILSRPQGVLAKLLRFGDSL